LLEIRLSASWGDFPVALKPDWRVPKFPVTFGSAAKKIFNLRRNKIMKERTCLLAVTVTKEMRSLDAGAAAVDLRKAGAHRTMRSLLLVTAFLAFALPLQAGNNDPIEPNAGKWRTWVISSPKDYYVRTPPKTEETNEELTSMADLIRHNDAQIQQQIAFWDAGAPAYRWIDLLNARMLAAIPTTAYPHRVYTYVALAMYDATIATWEWKYYYNRRRPSELNPQLPTALPVPNSPSYPSEHAAAAQAAAEGSCVFSAGGSKVVSDYG
jgi:hypothetical protein